VILGNARCCLLELYLELFLPLVHTDHRLTALQESRMPELEPPFRPREKLLELQRHFQNVHKHTYLKGRYDAVTSVGIPLALAASSLFLIVSKPGMLLLVPLARLAHHFSSRV